MYFTSVITALSALALVSSAPTANVLPKRGLAASACAKPVAGLTTAACQQMAQIGFNAQGVNSAKSNGVMWVGTDGPNTFTFKNGGTAATTIVGWNLPPGDYVAMCMNAVQGQITYTLAPGASTTVSIANGVSGSFSRLDPGTTLNNAGQVHNTWLEFTTGASATIDVSREVTMSGASISATVKGNGCTTSMNKCVFTCKSGDTCGASGSYSLDSCANGSQPGATFGTYGGNPSGGCQGFSNGGHVDVTL